LESEALRLKACILYFLLKAPPGGGGYAWVELSLPLLLHLASHSCCSGNHLLGVQLPRDFLAAAGGLDHGLWLGRGGGGRLGVQVVSHPLLAPTESVAWLGSQKGFGLQVAARLYLHP